MPRNKLERGLITYRRFFNLLLFGDKTKNPNSMIEAKGELVNPMAEEIIFRTGSPSDSALHFARKAAGTDPFCLDRFV